MPAAAAPEIGFAITSHFRAAICWQRGALTELEAEARAVLSRNAPYAFRVAAVHLADALVERGDPEAAALSCRRPDSTRLRRPP